MTALNRQPDEPRCFCPECGQSWPRQDHDIEKFLRKNAGTFPPAHLARFLNMPLRRVLVAAAQARPLIDLTLKKEPEPAGA